MMDFEKEMKLMRARGDIAKLERAQLSSLAIGVGIMLAVIFAVVLCAIFAV